MKPKLKVDLIKEGRLSPNLSSTLHRPGGSRAMQMNCERGLWGHKADRKPCSVNFDGVERPPLGPFFTMIAQHHCLQLWQYFYGH